MTAPTVAGLVTRNDAGGITFHVVGEPRPQGSARLIGGRLVTKTAALDYWRGQMAHKAAQAMADHALDTFAGPVAVTATFRLRMPANRPVWLHLLDGAPSWRQPDVDKLTRALLDALQEGGVLHNDAQVARIAVDKVEVAAGWLGVAVAVDPVPPPDGRKAWP